VLVSILRRSVRAKAEVIRTLAELFLCLDRRMGGLPGLQGRLLTSSRAEALLQSRERRLVSGFVKLAAAVLIEKRQPPFARRLIVGINTAVGRGYHARQDVSFFGDLFTFFSGLRDTAE